MDTGSHENSITSKPFELTENHHSIKLDFDYKITDDGYQPGEWGSIIATNPSNLSYRINGGSWIKFREIDEEVSNFVHQYNYVVDEFNEGDIIEFRFSWNIPKCSL